MKTKNKKTKTMRRLALAAALLLILALLLFTLGLAVLDAIIKQMALLESFTSGNFLANLVSGCILYVSLGGVGWLIGWLLHYAKESTHENKS